MEPSGFEARVIPPAAPAPRRRATLLVFSMAGLLGAAAFGYLVGNAARSDGSARANSNLVASLTSNMAGVGLVDDGLLAAPPGATSCPPRPGVVGTLKSVDGSTLVVTSRGGQDVKVNTSGTTKIRRTLQGSVSDVTTGATVLVHGTPGPSDLAADTVILAPSDVSTKLGKAHPNMATRGLALGTVKSVSGGTFVVAQPDGTTVTVTTSSTTKVIKTVDAKLSDLQTGQPVAARGTAGPDGTIAATEVDQMMAGLPGKFGGLGHGFQRRGRWGPPGAPGEPGGASTPTTSA